ncbi:hypothetical protein [Nonomuraea sp. NPDC049309]|uniref:hypothetical protein n=1 Tax=Nonomuraea sp. NPDC049309 TaxID=3364350 RepID=UPI00371B1CEF
MGGWRSAVRPRRPASAARIWRADDNDAPGPLFDWLTSGDVPLDDSGALKVSQASYGYTRAY